MRIFWAMMTATSMPAMAAAQQAPVPAPAPVAAPAAQAEPEVSDEPDIIVAGQRNLPGAVVGDIPPDQQLGPADIRSYGVSSVQDLLTELAPQTRSGAGGAPVVLLDGRRIAGFQEIRDIPTEAIARVDILPEEVALKYGYSADQRVVNIVLRRRFRATTVEAADRIATEGGRTTPQGELDLLNIRNGGRFNVHTEYQQSSALLESERSIAPVAGEIDQRPYRTLQNASRSLSINSIYAKPIGKVSATVNAEIEATDSTGQFGLPSASFLLPADNDYATAGTATTVTRTIDTPGIQSLRQRNAALTAHLGTTLTGMIDSWNWSLTGSYDRVENDTVTDTGVDAAAFQARIDANDPAANPFGTLTARDFGALPGNRGTSVSSTGQVDALANGSLFALPAGDVSTTVRVGATTSDFSSRSYRAGLTNPVAPVSRDGVNGRINVDVPITSRSRDILGAIGNLSLSGNAAINQLSDFGTLTSYGYGANWSPVDGVRVIGSINEQQGAPSAAQLGNPLINTPNARVFDYVRGTTATVTTITGGNPLLRAEDRRVTKLGLTLKPWKATDLTLTANYVDTRIDNPIVSFPSASAAIEAAFPDRFTRDGGTLTRIDTRPVNFARSDSAELRWGINFSKPIRSKIQKELAAFRAGTGPNPFAGLNLPGRRPDGQGGGDRPAGEGAGRGGGGGGGRGGFGGGGFGGGGRGGQGGGRLQFAFYHTWHLTDRVLVADGGPRLDLLRGDAIGGNGGQPRHEFELQSGYSNNGIGVRLSGNYATGTQVNGGTAANVEQLNFGGLATANLRLFADLGQQLGLVKAHPWVRGARVTLSVDNLFNTRQRVTDATGATPVSYQPDYLDPLGRTIRISLRKLFF